MMSRVTDNEAIQAARALKGYCDSNAICNRCMFYNHKISQCSVPFPYAWEIHDLIPEESQDSKHLREREEFFRGGG